MPLKARPADSLKRFLTLRGTGSVTASQKRFKLKKKCCSSLRLGCCSREDSARFPAITREDNVEPLENIVYN